MTSLPLAETELEVDHQVVGKTPDKQANQKNGDYNSEHFEQNFASYLKSVQQQALSRNMAALPETDSEEDNDVLVHHQVAVDTSRTRQKTQTKASKATEEQVRDDCSEAE